jgi:ABC-type dipeptide/oligopeptide/nickel transport system ATPase subunit
MIPVVENDTIVSIRNLSKLYAQGEIQVTALDNISLDIAAGEFLTREGGSFGTAEEVTNR